MRDCRNCRHNTYAEIKTDFVSCGHPVTLAKMPKWQAGHPAWVVMQTADMQIEQMASRLGPCETWEAARPTPAAEGG